MTFMGEGYYRGMEETYSRRIDELMKENETLISQNRELVEALKRIAYGEPHGGDNTDDLPKIAFDVLYKTGSVEDKAKGEE